MRASIYIFKSMLPAMLVREVMNRKVIVLRPEDSLRHAVSVFARNGISGAPVVDARNRLVGIITEMDILRRLEIGSLEFGSAAAPPGEAGVPGDGQPGLRFKPLRESLEAAADIPVSRIMISPVVTAHPDDQAHEKAALMVHRRIRRLPVIDARGVLVGILSRKDLLRMLDMEGPLPGARPRRAGGVRKPKGGRAGGR